MRRLRKTADQIRKSTGQALVEFTLAATLIFFLVSAAVDLGLIFFSVQALRAAAQEGATFGSYPIQITSGGSVQHVTINYRETIARIRAAAGNTNPSGFPRSQGIVNLYDLNNNDVDDAAENVIAKPGATSVTAVTTGRIQIDNPAEQTQII